MKSMIEIFKERLFEELTIINIKEERTQFKVTVKFNGNEGTAVIPKQCSPDKVEKTVDFLMYSAVIDICIENEDWDNCKNWNERKNLNYGN